MLEDIMHSCQLSLISKDSPEVQYNLINRDPDNRNDLLYNKTLGRAQDPHANGSWLSKLTEWNMKCLS